MWSAVKAFGEVLAVLQPYAVIGSFVGICWTVFQMWKFRDSWRAVEIKIQRADSTDRHSVASIPWRFASRAEVQGLIANAAGGERLDFSSFHFDYKYRRAIIVPLPNDQYDLILGKVRHAA
jgi:hypothetical protein